VKLLKSILDAARQSCTKMVTYRARLVLPPPSPLSSLDAFIFLACGVRIINAQEQIVVEANFFLAKWQQVLPNIF
jgi:hypothetical protein